MINRHITTLLRRHDCVIMPGVGAFVANRVPAVFDSVSGRFMPPARTISFNPAITHDDGLIASSLSRRMKISFEQARERLHEESALMQRRLKAEGSVTISHVGTLYRHSDSRIDFRADKSWLIELPSVACLRPIEKPTIEIVRPATTETEKKVAIVRVPLHLRRLRAAAAALVIFIVGFALSTPIDLQQAQNASLAAPAFTAPEVPKFEPLPAPEGMELNLAAAPSDGILSTVKPQPELPKNYVVVVASLPTLEQAKKFIDRSSTSGLQILQSGDKFRVYAAAGTSQEDAMAAAMAIDGFRSAYPDAWVCRR
ncbi:MAG: SPOR domain-containing protein [Muribaculaceae bacterium]|nr:SPOR domain-containing protein [Muribaculaceae bacterium]